METKFDIEFLGWSNEATMKAFWTIVNTRGRLHIQVQGVIENNPDKDYIASDVQSMVTPYLDAGIDQTQIRWEEIADEVLLRL